MMNNYILITNDDGVDAPGIYSLAQALIARGYRIVILAPEDDCSATGMSITLGRELILDERTDIARKLGPSAKVLSLGGSPCDCIIVGLSGALDDVIPEAQPMLCVSGVNLGPNVSVDVLHSGTVGAAREAALYGLPAIAASSAEFTTKGLEQAVEATVQVVEMVMNVIPEVADNLLRPQLGGIRDDTSLEKGARLRAAFCRGDAFLNLNTPLEWDGEIRPSNVGMRWYRNALHRGSEDDTYLINGVEIINQPEKNCDVGTLLNGSSSLTISSAWPEGHPLCLSADLLTHAMEVSDSGTPRWLC